MLQAAHFWLAGRMIRSSGAAVFIVCRWLLAVCNIPELCEWLVVASSLAGAMYLGSFPWVRLISGSAALGRIGGLSLALTCAVNLAVTFLSIVVWSESPELAATIALLDGVSWLWGLWASLLLARWLWPNRLEVGSIVAPLPLRYMFLSILIACVIGLQMLVFVNRKQTWWPFQDYPLYSSSHGTPVRALHYRLYGLTAKKPYMFIEISPEALKESFFVYHTQFVPRLFANPSTDLDDFHRRLNDSHLPKFQLLLAERTTFGLNDSQLVEFPEHQLVWLDPETVEP